METLHCMAFDLRLSIEAHYGLWTVAVTLSLLLTGGIIKAIGNELVLGIYALLVVCIGLLGAFLLIWLPVPDYCAADGPENFTINVPGFLKQMHTDVEWLYSDEKQSSVRVWPLWPDKKNTANAWSVFVDAHRKDRAQAMREISAGGVTVTDSSITRSNPAYVLRWQTATYDVLYAMCYQRLDGKLPEAAGIEGMARLRRMEIAAPLHGSAFKTGDYENLTAQFLANCGLSPKPKE